MKPLGGLTDKKWRYIIVRHLVSMTKQAQFSSMELTRFSWFTVKSVVLKIDRFLIKTKAIYCSKIVSGQFYRFTDLFLSVLKTDQFPVFQSLFQTGRRWLVSLVFTRTFGVSDRSNHPRFSTGA
jgi:hypothetical protein